MQIETPRLHLRDFTHDDVEAIALSRADDRFWQFNDRPEDIDANAREQFELFARWAAEDPRSHYQLAVVLKDTGVLIGNCGLRQRSKVLEGGMSELGYELDPRYWHHGYASEAARAIVDYGFESLRLHRVWAFCKAANEPSWRLMERLGMRREGVLRKHTRLRGEWVDACTYGILAEEWKPSSEPIGSNRPIGS